MQNLRRHPLSGPCKCLTLVPALQFAPYKVVSVYLLPMGMHGYSVWVFFFFCRGADNSLSVVAADVLLPSIFPLL